MGRPSRRSIEKLTAELAELNMRRGREIGSISEFNLTLSEQQFVATADVRGKHLYRAGWPDFLCIDKDTKGVIFVEVKHNGDEIRPAQVVMFAALEEHLGIRVMVWDPRWPAKLLPWRKYAEDNVTSPRKKSGPRQRSPRLVSRGGKSGA